MMMAKTNLVRSANPKTGRLKTLIPDIVVSATYSVTILSALQVIGYFTY